MVKNETSCIKVSDTEICPFCKSKNIIKNGFTKNKKQQYICKSCCKRFIDFYTNKAYYNTINSKIIKCIKEGLGIRSTARMIEISTTTLLRRIVLIARKITPPCISKGKIYEVDEMRCYLRKKDKPIWIVYALERKTKKVVNFRIGRRTKRTLQYVTNSLVLSTPKAIYTDGLKQYKSIIEAKFHKVKRYGTNHIERNNLTIRTHVKRLSRKTICYSKSFVILMCVMRIYFWG